MKNETMKQRKVGFKNLLGNLVFWSTLATALIIVILWTMGLKLFNEISYNYFEMRKEFDKFQVNIFDFINSNSKHT